jgi:tetratricopeptide (TPR) repeat protein
VTREQDTLLATAESGYKKSLAHTEDDATLWSNLAWIEAFRGETDSAADSFERAIQADPNDVATRVGAGLFYERRALEAKAIEEYAHAVAVSPRIVNSKFFEDLRVRSPDAAKAIVARACDLLNTFPASPIHLASLARLHAFLGEVALSHDEYVEVLALLPNLSYTWANLEPVINFVPLFAKG